MRWHICRFRDLFASQDNRLKVETVEIYCCYDSKEGLHRESGEPWPQSSADSLAGYGGPAASVIL